MVQTENQDETPQQEAAPAGSPGARAAAPHPATASANSNSNGNSTSGSNGHRASLSNRTSNRPTADQQHAKQRQPDGGQQNQQRWPDISVVIPLYNEEESLRELHQQLKATLGRMSQRYELVFVDDGSTDKSFQVLRDLKRSTGTSRSSASAATTESPQRSPSASKRRRGTSSSRWTPTSRTIPRRSPR